MDDNFPVKSKNRKTKRILISAIIAALIIALFAFIFSFLFPALLLGGFFDNPPDQNHVVKLVSENIDTFEDAIEYIKTLDSDVFGIEYENGSLYLSDSSYTNPQISNDKIEEIFNLGVESICIKNKNVEFYCGGAGRQYGTGIIYSNDGEPITFQLDDYINESRISFTKTGDGWEWKEEGGDNHYYCKKIVDNWYYYQMWW